MSLQNSTGHEFFIGSEIKTGIPHWEFLIPLIQADIFYQVANINRDSPPFIDHLQRIKKKTGKAIEHPFEKRKQKNRFIKLIRILENSVFQNLYFTYH